MQRRPWPDAMWTLLCPHLLPLSTARAETGRNPQEGPEGRLRGSELKGFDSIQKEMSNRLGSLQGSSNTAMLRSERQVGTGSEAQRKKGGD